MTIASPLLRPTIRIPRRVAGLSTAAPYAVPAPGFGTGVLRLLSGAPAPEALPLDDFAVASAELFGGPSGAAALNYGPHAGSPGLRQWIGAREQAAAGSVLITNGALHGVSLTFNSLLEPDDVVVLDDPVFPDTVRIVEQYGARVLPVPIGPHGIDVGAVATHLAGGTRIKALYTVADFHNPSGSVLPGQARTELVELADRYGFVIVSDNPYRDTTFAGTYEPDFAADSDRVVRVGTFTKTLGAGLRLGWVIAPDWLLPHLENLRRRTDFHSGVVSQALVESLVTRPGWFEDVLRRNRSVHADKAAAFTDALAALRPGLLDFTTAPGGFFVWARLADSAPPTDRLLAEATARGLLLTSGRHFAADGGPQWDRHLRFAFSAPTLSELPLAVERLAAAFAAAR